MIWHQFGIVQLIIHQFVWKVLSVQFISRTLSALARIYLAGSARLGFGPVHQVFNVFGGAVLGPLQWKFQPTGPGFIIGVEG